MEVTRSLDFLAPLYLLYSPFPGKSNPLVVRGWYCLHRMDPWPTKYDVVDNSISLKVERKRISAKLPLLTRIRPTSQFETFNVRTNASSCGRLRLVASLLWNVIKCSVGSSGRIVATGRKAFLLHILDLLHYLPFFGLVAKSICLSPLFSEEFLEVSLL
ncbi:hypothetical protein TIFTF001_029328 [Ficus carica]|uniref:Uncharacterized protein n=1 Tax=Ficus carica TaxID=3494 RepID=A0AA88DRJ5_FICCA|nr:hypothetical protein TIFTF001_029328 [Ficus carica]